MKTLSSFSAVANMDRRRLLKTGAAAIGLGALANLLADEALAALPFRIGHTLAGGAIEETVKVAARVGLRGIESSRDAIIPYRSRPEDLRRLFEANGRILSSSSNEGAGMSTDWLSPENIPQTIRDHVDHARFLRDVGMSNHFKVVPTRARPDSGPTDDMLKRMSDAWNEAGRQMAAFGIRFSPHNHVGTSFYLEPEIRRVMELTEPGYVSITADTAHFQLGGMNSAVMIRELLPRIALVHYKDVTSDFSGSGNVLTEMSGIPYFRNFGAGGVDFVEVHKVLVENGFNNWVNLDVDGRMVEALGRGVEGCLAYSRDYVIDTLKVDRSEFA